MMAESEKLTLMHSVKLVQMLDATCQSWADDEAANQRELEDQGDQSSGPLLRFG